MHFPLLIHVHQRWQSMTHTAIHLLLCPSVGLVVHVIEHITLLVLEEGLTLVILVHRHVASILVYIGFLTVC